MIATNTDKSSNIVISAIEQCTHHAMYGMSRRDGFTRGGLMVAKSHEGWFFSIKSVDGRQHVTDQSMSRR
jgi:hypothetical protein